MTIRSLRQQKSTMKPCKTLSAELQPENPSDVTTTASRSKQNPALCYGNMRNETGHSFPLSRRERGTGGEDKRGAGGFPARRRRHRHGRARTVRGRDVRV